MTDSEPQPAVSRLAVAGLFGGPLLGLLVYLLLGAFASDLTPAGRSTAGVAVLMAAWWMTEALPLPITSLVPLVALPLLGILPTEAAAAPYADKNIFLFMGGFIIALAVERWNLHRRIALLTLLAVGTHPRQLIGGIMLATGALSMWMSNTATTAMMLPIGMSLVMLVRDQWRTANDGLANEAEQQAHARTFATCLMLAIAYSASIGGLGTLVGTPTNLFLAGFAQSKSLPLSFVQWMAFALPLAAAYLALAWWLMTGWIFPIRMAELPGGRQVIRQELAKLGRVTRGEWTVLSVFCLVALGWVFRPLITGADLVRQWLPILSRLDDTTLAMTGAIALFAIPINLRQGVFAMDWQHAMKLPWGVLLLFGGGFSLADAVAQSQLADWIGTRISILSGIPILALIIVVSAMILLLTELTSNTPTAAAFLPILYGVAEGMQTPPMLFLVPATLAASCAFMLPVATPPNAIVFGSGHVTMKDMVRAGVWLNLLGLILIPAFVLLWGPLTLPLGASAK